MKKKLRNLNRIRLAIIRNADTLDLDGADWKARMVAWHEINKDIFNEKMLIWREYSEYIP